MNKDVIYIDVDDDITVISSKLKSSKEKIVALVPPKRTGVLQSVVNLRILQRVAKRAEKRLVLITNDPALLPLAAGAEIPVAKNLQSRPEVPEVPALKLDDDDDIIDGSDLSVGDHADSAKGKKDKSADAAVAAVVAKDKLASAPKDGEAAKRPKKAQKVPNFNKFRKKLFIIGALLLLLIGFLVWAIWFAPRANVILSAKTSAQNINTSVALREAGDTSAEDGTLRVVSVSEESEASVEFEATGSREEGEKATGVITISNCSSRRGVEIEAGTAISYGNYNYLTNSSVQVPGGDSSSPFGGCDRPGTANVSVTAQNIGDEYNVRADTSFDVAGNSGMSATNRNAISGGSKRTVKIVTQGDVQRASEQLASQNGDNMQETLQDKLDRDARMIPGSFVVERADAVVSPEVGEDAGDGKAKLSSKVTYKITGVKESELKKFLEHALMMNVSQENGQRVYDAGEKEVTFTDFQATAEGGAVSISTTGQIGPQVSDEDVKARTKGKRFGDIQEDLKSIKGIDNVEVDFWPFWVNEVPEDDKKISVQFELEQARTESGE